MCIMSPRYVAEPTLQDRAKMMNINVFLESPYSSLGGCSSLYWFCLLGWRISTHLSSYSLYGCSQSVHSVCWYPRILNLLYSHDYREFAICLYSPMVSASLFLHPLLSFVIFVPLPMIIPTTMVSCIAISESLLYISWRSIPTPMKWLNPSRSLMMYISSIMNDDLEWNCNLSSSESQQTIYSLPKQI